MKRLFDLFASGCGLIVLSPLFLVVSILIKIDSRGPVFYRQVRVGFHNRDFRIFKFRTMRVGSDKGSLVTIGGRDPRVTRVGYYLRKFKVDELPQLINVFIGDMSLVGPRPEVRHYVDYWTPEQLHVLDVRPGITDPASIKFRNENELMEKAENPEATEEKTEDARIPFRYIGQAFNLFLIAEIDGELVFIDQHAAHERILYNELIKQKSVQKLLVPIHIETDSISSAFLDRHSHVYTKLGIMLAKRDDGEWEITSLPAACRPIETEIVDFIQSARVDGNELESRLFAIVACRAAIKAGDAIDRWSAEEILRKVFAMKEPACPHGRTFLMKISEKELRLLAGRTG